MTDEKKPGIPMETASLSIVSEDDDDDDVFVFSDEIHGQQEIQHLSQSLSALGFDIPELPPPTKSTSHPNDRSLLALEKAFEKGQEENLKCILDEIDRIAERQAAKGMREWNFTWGLLNCLGIAYIFGAYPGHFWIVYLFESILWIGRKFVLSFKPPPALNECLYFLDFFWMMNFLLVLVIVMLGVTSSDMLSLETRRQIYMGAYGIAAGPVFLAAMSLPFVAFLFHDANTMANLIIHILPSMLIYIARWHPDKVKEAYPDMFRLDYIEDSSMIPFDGWTSGSVSWNSTLVFLAWWVPYVVWMLTIGMELPRQSADGRKTPKYDTVFHSLWRGGPCELVGGLAWKRPKAKSREQSELDDFETRDFLLYIVLHGCVCIVIGIHGLARICHANPWAHGICLWISIIICATRGAKRYTYYTNTMYGQHIRKHFAKKLVGQKKKEK